MTKDPIGIAGGLNQYVFCGNNPVTHRDPWGLCDESKFKKAKKSILATAGVISIGSVAVAGPDPSDVVIQPATWATAGILIGGAYVVHEAGPAIASFAQSSYEKAKELLKRPRKDPPWGDRPQPPEGPIIPPDPKKPWWALLLEAIESFMNR